MRRLLFASLLVVIANTPLAFGQGVQTGTITGVVQSSDTEPLPGVTVTATSPVLLGRRSAVTDVNGVYVIRGLPAGRPRRCPAGPISRAIRRC
jgi:hypothetical protein